MRCPYCNSNLVASARNAEMLEHPGPGCAHTGFSDSPRTWELRGARASAPYTCANGHAPLGVTADCPACAVRMDMLDQMDAVRAHQDALSELVEEQKRTIADMSAEVASVARMRSHMSAMESALNGWPGNRGAATVKCHRCGQESHGRRPGMRCYADGCSTGVFMYPEIITAREDVLVIRRALDTQYRQRAYRAASMATILEKMLSLWDGPDVTDTSLIMQALELARKDEEPAGVCCGCGKTFTPELDTLLCPSCSGEGRLRRNVRAALETFMLNSDGVPGDAGELF